LGGHVCQAFHFGPDATGESRFCACVDPASACSIPEPPPFPPQCGAGPCPPGLACHAVQFSGVELCTCDTP
jgi:hypothetical protein